MYIERIQVEEGFLDKLDLTFQPGLNVLIGARGTGKTSVLELIRFCLNAPAFTEFAATQSHEQARSILAGGEVSVTLRDGDTRILVSRSASDQQPRATSSFTLPVVVSQREAEVIGALPGGRMQLLDRFRTDTESVEGRAPSLIRELRSLTAEIGTLAEEIALLAEQEKELSRVPSELEAAATEQAALLATVAMTKGEQERLEQLQRDLAQLGIRQQTLRAASTAIEAYAQTVRDVAQRAPAITWPEAAGENQLVDAAARLAAARSELAGLYETLTAIVSDVAGRSRQTEASRVAAEQESRELRSKLNEIQAGAADVTRLVSTLTERQGQFDATRELLRARVSTKTERRSRRDALYEELDRLRKARFESRKSVAASLSDALGPAIRVRLTSSADTAAYAEAIATALRGSGLQYNRLAPTVAAAMSPLELVSAIEDGDFQTLAELASISPERAATAVSSARGHAADIVAVSIGDVVEMELLDGLQYKGTAEMSIGQRCTVVLPILLESHPEMLLVDQPEDNLDNAFITGTLIRTIRSRRPTDQMIMASHNANIPVLGEAEQVTLLESDGHRASVKHSGTLDSPETVKAVTTVMEGGLAAFRQRSRFYEQILRDPSR
ncbi:MAG: hypothetical protein AMXMBFR23_15380 [Chloroflexota bacterium]